MVLDEKARKTLAELEACDAEAVAAIFEDAAKSMSAERDEFLSAARNQPAQRDALAKALRDRWLARKNGLLAHIDENWLKKTPPPLKPAAGRSFNELRRTAAAMETAELIRDAASHAQVSVADSTSTGRAPVSEAKRAQDLTLPGYCHPAGSLHPITQVQREIEDIFIEIGFAIETGPEIESVYYNFDALNIPESHPARDDWDTFYIDAQTVLRTHTSPVQIRAMEQRGAPLYILIPGTCYRRDNPDATHSPMFHQIEGLAIDQHISFADLKGTLEFFARRFFGESTHTRFQPSFFPFTEPSGEVAICCPFCSGEGCRVCKQGGWIEVMGCGMVHPEVLRHGGIDPARYTGWAFGLGVERYAMMKYGINDIQLFYQSDVRFLEQF